MQIVDVDFRWVKRKSPEPVFAGNVWLNHVQVLQWRKRVPFYNDDPNVTSKWSDWQDVRTEEE
jgi:hypothetical protein